jgi:hypothetical protein
LGSFCPKRRVKGRCSRPSSLVILGRSGSREVYAAAAAQHVGDCFAQLCAVRRGGKWIEIAVHADPLYQHLLLTAGRKLWRCVQTGEPPRVFGVEPPQPRIEPVRIVDMSSSNSWAEFARVFRANPGHLPRAPERQGRAQAPNARGRPGGDRTWTPGQTLEIRGDQL